MDQINLHSEDAFRDLFKRLVKVGKRCSPRGQLVIEAENFTYELPAYVKFPSFVARKYSESYVRNELLWYLRANAEDKTILKHAKMWTDLVNKDGTINSNYGRYVFGTTDSYVTSPNWPNQFDAVVKTLIADKDSRRASIVICQPYHLLMETNDVPCTYSMNFRIRENKLHMSVHMRSQDAMFGMGNDAPAFSMFQEMIYVTLRDTCYADLEMGNYHHICDSFHVYERHFEMLDAIVNGDKFAPIACPFISSISEVQHLRGTIHLEYRDGKEARSYPYVRDLKETINRNKHLMPNLGVVFSKDEFLFSQWLVEGAWAAEEKEDKLAAEAAEKLRQQPLIQPHDQAQ